MLATVLLAAALTGQPAAPPPATGAPRRANLNSYFTQSDYPIEAMRRNEQGTVIFRIGVGTDGRAASCAVTVSSGSTRLDRTTCRLLLERLRFTPASDLAGNPRPGSFEGRVTWDLPRGDRRARRTNPAN